MKVLLAREMNYDYRWEYKPQLQKKSIQNQFRNWYSSTIAIRASAAVIMTLHVIIRTIAS